MLEGYLVDCADGTEGLEFEVTAGTSSRTRRTQKPMWGSASIRIWV